MVEVVVEKEEEKFSTKMNTMNKVGDAAAAADVDNGREEKLTVVVIGAAASGTKVLVDEEEEEKIKSRTSTDETIMSSSTNVKAAAAAAGDHPTTVVVDGKKLKAWVTQLTMWSCVYYLMYWIMVMINMDYYYGVAAFLHGIILISLFFVGILVTGGIRTVNQINSLVLFVNNNIVPSPGTFRSSTTSIDEMKKEIRVSFTCLLFISIGFNFIHLIIIEISKILMELIGTKNKVGESAKVVDDWISPKMLAGCIFFVTFLHILWYDHAISKELGIDWVPQTSDIHTASINQPHGQYHKCDVSLQLP